MRIPFQLAGRLPEPGDNVAIACRRLEAGTEIVTSDQAFRLPFTILEGHRFALVPIRKKEALLSWGLPFGFALRDIIPGDYVCNSKILHALAQRHVDFVLPREANFDDYQERFQWDEKAFRPGEQVPAHDKKRFFMGYNRGSRRGVGIRNFIIVLGTTSLTSGFARQLADQFKSVPEKYSNIDGVVAVAHTEGAGSSAPNNLGLLLRTLAGFLVNPNVGAVLAADIGTEPVTNRLLQEYLTRNQYPIDDVLHGFLSIQSDYRSALAKGAEVIESWLEKVNASRRSAESLEHIRIGLQCGGSDAFSGVSGNPLAGWLSKELVRYGGSANLAETDELIGAESYVLQNVRDAATARQFLNKVDKFQEWAGWHGHSAEGNPSGGNNFRGLYNIAIKSIGAARKKDPEVRLDYVIDYSQPMTKPGFYFMDSPGNDLESIAGQVAAGCNIIVFTTGNGSITNFPFVPTIKIMTNSGRYQMLTREMDVNAGRYMDGTPMDILGQETFELMIRIASGERSAGEKAGHSQVQIWREWRQNDGSSLERIQNTPLPSGEPLPITAISDVWKPSNFRFRALRIGNRYLSRKVGLILPTSLCSGQIGRMIAEKLNREAQSSGMHYVALAHTEGCGVSGGNNEEIHLRTMAGYLVHPTVWKGLLLEHGCEKTHNDAMRNFLTEHAISAGEFGQASIQLDGGLESVTKKVTQWFCNRTEDSSSEEDVGLEKVSIALMTPSSVPGAIAKACALITRAIVQSGGTVVVPQNTSLLDSPHFVDGLIQVNAPAPSLAYGQPLTKVGFHIMETPTEHFVETLTGLGATGVQAILAFTESQAVQSNPMVPLIQIGVGSAVSSTTADLDLCLKNESASSEYIAEQSLQLLGRVLSRDYTPKMFAQGNVDFQITRGLLGVSL